MDELYTVLDMLANNSKLVHLLLKQYEELALGPEDNLELVERHLSERKDLIAKCNEGKEYLARLMGEPHEQSTG